MVSVPPSQINDSLEHYCAKLPCELRASIFLALRKSASSNLYTLFLILVINLIY